MTTIDALIQRKQPFAVYRVPGEKYPRLLTEDVGAVRLIFDLKELNGQRGFVIAPFRVDKSCPIVLIQSDRTGQPLPMEIVAEEEQGLQSYPEESFHTLCTGKYATCFHTFIEALRDATFDKLVLSRSLTIGKNPEFSPSAVFVQLVNVIFIPISICVILLRRACGWEVLPKLYCRAKK